MAFQIEVTDTFGGEPKNCWVNRKTVHKKVTERGAIRMAKAFAGLTGMRCSVDDCGGHTTIRPIGRNAPCIIVFIIDIE